MYGRVGYDGQTDNNGFVDAKSAIKHYTKKYKEKTRPGKGYVEIQINYDDKDEESS